MNEIRDATKWLTAAAGAIGVVVVAGLQLGDLGHARGWRFAAAIAAAALALLLVGYVIFAASKVLTGMYTTLLELVEPASKVPGVLQGESSMPRWASHELTWHVNAALSELTPGWWAPPDGEDGLPAFHRDRLQFRQKLAQGLEAGDPIGEKAMEMDAAAERIVAYANEHIAKRAYEHFRFRLLAAGALIASGAVVFTVATHPPTPDELRVTQPTRMQLNLSDQGRQQLGSELGQACVQGSIDVVAVGGSFDRPRVLIVPSGACAGYTRPIQVLPSQGAAVPGPT